MYMVWETETLGILLAAQWCVSTRFNELYTLFARFFTFSLGTRRKLQFFSTSIVDTVCCLSNKTNEIQIRSSTFALDEISCFIDPLPFKTSPPNFINSTFSRDGPCLIPCAIAASDCCAEVSDEGERYGYCICKGGSAVKQTLGRLQLLLQLDLFLGHSNKRVLTGKSLVINSQ